MPKDDWENANCYGYALRLNICIAPGSSNDGESAIEWDSSGTVISAKHREELLSACAHDGLVEPENASQEQIAVFINVYSAQLDYHFYRKDGGVWSHKMSNTGEPVTGLADPLEANKALVGLADANGDVIIGQEFCGYLYKKVVKGLEDFGF